MLVLASSSRARRAMLEAAGVAFTVEPPSVDEGEIRASLQQEGLGPRDIADALAEAKAAKVSRRNPQALVLGADQLLVTADGALLEKPEGREATAAQLRRLRGTEHRLLSAAVIAQAGAPVWRALDEARLLMRSFSEPFLQDYVDREGEAISGCLGGYRLEGPGVQLFARIRGDHFTVRGLPLLALLEYLRERGLLLA